MVTTPVSLGDGPSNLQAMLALDVIGVAVEGQGSGGRRRRHVARDSPVRTAPLLLAERPSSDPVHMASLAIKGNGGCLRESWQRRFWLRSQRRAAKAEVLATPVPLQRRRKIFHPRAQRAVVRHGCDHELRCLARGRCYDDHVPAAFQAGPFGAVLQICRQEVERRCQAQEEQAANATLAEPPTVVSGCHLLVEAPDPLAHKAVVLQLGVCTFARADVPPVRARHDRLLVEAGDGATVGSHARRPCGRLAGGGRAAVRALQAAGGRRASDREPWGRWPVETRRASGWAPIGDARAACTWHEARS
eukprot:CAMPEP_0179066050 /NCGR_PEP_ID=MMETSP0796-20121207/28780_1 /TAXON_ID=73915 /ORGANISM="Pyrodinium bahamense, Strain pbaha01" /LENGTH=303 /DNA_ID=CAMNT_0020763049 /DNA_START=537 /DNA_END=1445 /DNA_ORIENTATION=+